MKVNCSSATTVMPTPNVFIGTSDSLENNLKKVFKMCLNKISVIESKAQDPQPMSASKMTPSLVKPKSGQKWQSKIIAYPHSDLDEILSIMKALKLEYVSIAKHPWNKELIGIMEKHDIETAIRNMH